MQGELPPEGYLWFWSLVVTFVLSFVPGYLMWSRKRTKWIEPLVVVLLAWYAGTRDVVQWLAVHWFYGKPALIYDGTVIYLAAAIRWWDWLFAGMWLVYGAHIVDKAMKPNVPPPAEPESTNQGD